MAEHRDKGKRLGKYTIQDVLGEGSFGLVYRVWDPDLEKSLAVKKLKSQSHGQAASPKVDTNLNFTREARETAKLQHVNIVTVHGFGTDETDKAPYLVMEFLQGQTLEKVVQAGTTPLVERLEIMQQVAEGLQYAHTKGVTHRDIKPANIMILADGTARVLDFSVAPEGYLVGTPAYMAPEQFNNGQASDILTDVFSYGAVYYELLTGKRAFDPDSRDRAQASGYRPPPVSSLVPDCPAWLDDVIARLMDHRRDERIDTLEAMLLFTRPILQKIKQEYAAGLAAGIESLKNKEERDRLIDRVLRLDPTNRAAMGARGTIREGHREQNRSRARALTSSAQSKFDQGEFVEAEKLLEEALLLDSNTPEGERLLASARAKAEDGRMANFLLDEVLDDIIDAGPKGLMPFQVKTAFGKLTRAVHLDPRCRDAGELRTMLFPVYESIQKDELDRAGTGVADPQQNEAYQARIRESQMLRKRAKTRADYDLAESLLRNLLAHVHDARALRELNSVLGDRAAQIACDAALQDARGLQFQGDLKGAKQVLDRFAEEYFRKAIAVQKERNALEAEIAKLEA